MTYSVIQWATGKNGMAALRAILEHPDLDLVGCRVYSDDKCGRDAGEIAGLGHAGVAATTDRQAILDLDADVVIYTPMINLDTTQLDRDILDLLRSGKNVIDVSATNPYPPGLGPEWAAPFEAACRDGGSTLFGAGINPGFIGERLATTLSGLAIDLRRLLITEHYDCSQNASEALVMHTIGFGAPPGSWSTQSAFFGFFRRMYTQVLHAVAATIGVAIDRIEEHIDLVVADGDIPIKSGVVRAGTVSGIDFTLEAVPTAAEQPRIACRSAWTIRDHTTGPDPDSGWTIQMEGAPSITTTVRYLNPDVYSDHASLYVAAAIRSIPQVVAAAPGILLPTVFAPYRPRFDAV